MSSSETAIAYHSISIGDGDREQPGNWKNTWDDWHLVPTSRPKFNMPQAKTSFIDIPGGDGMLDLTTALTGRPTYGNRQGSFEFIVMNDYGNWYERYSDIANYLHGKSFKAILDDDPDYYYEGRFYVNEWKSDQHWSQITIDYNVGPYKMSVTSTGSKWLWDPFDFIEGYIEDYRDMPIDGTHSIVYHASAYETYPVFSCSANGTKPFSMSVTIHGEGPYTLRLGTNTLENASFLNGVDNAIVFTGTGTVSIENSGGSL